MEINIETKNSFPAYAEILKEIGNQLRLRKILLIKRVLMITWPILLTFLVLFIINKFSKENEGLFALVFNNPKHSIYFYIWIVVIFVYYLLASSVFAIERIIWIDSFFDKINLNPSRSWQISKKLLFPATKLYTYVVIRYYFPPVLMFLIGFSFPSLLVGVVPKIFLDIIFGIGLISFLSIPFYFYYLKIKLRFLWFIFIDFYENDIFSCKNILSEVKKLNSVSRGEMFKKMLVINLGADSLNGISRSLLKHMGEKIGTTGLAGQFIGSGGRVFSEEFSKQIISIAKLTATYLLYKHARKVIYGEEQKINEIIYNL